MMNSIILGFLLSCAIAGAFFWPVQETRLEAVPADAVILDQLGLERVVQRRQGTRIVIEVYYDGVLRGKLVDLDLGPRILMIPSRPPHGWKIGGR